MTRTRCQNWLAVIWALFFVIQIGLLVMRSIAGASGSEEGRTLTVGMWNWYIPMVAPTLTLIAGALFAAPASDTRDTSLVRVGILIVLSLAYLLSISALLVLPPSLGTTPQDHLQLLQNSNYWLGAFQLCIAGALGTFFPKQSAE
ncbi:hypothetical protein AWB71_00025 [Caballeronia peredens]|nr:hypothetical protein AWB71_00025 [Caballeronia peredens]